MMRDAWLVYLKELTDALRDRRTLLMVLLSSVAIVPLVLVLVSSLVAGIEKRAEAREVMAQGLEHAPSLRNYLLRQTYNVLEAPADHEQQLKDSKLGHPVLVVPETFEADIARGVKSPELHERMVALGMEPVGSTAEEYDALIRSEIDKWQGVVKKAGIKLE